ncbi:MAG TPA: peptidase M28, partial [Cyclobacteriaceae bacterium]|nr:peptidase M28 [Cyclobacteriaceae bacterium]
MKKVTVLAIALALALFVSCSRSPSLTRITDRYFDLGRPEFKGEVAYETTAFVEKYWRVAGNTGFNESIARIVAALEASGYVLESKAKAGDRLTYRVETRTMEKPTWEPVAASLSIVGAHEKLLDQSTNRN